jgi:carboxypeptidase Taq
MFGYFPTYTLGSLYAAQLIEAYGKTANLDAEIAKGDFAPLLVWLKKEIFLVGDRLPTEDLITRVTGKGLSADAYFRHLAAKLG